MSEDIQWYKGHKGIPKANTRWEITEEEKQDFFKCAKDPLHFGSTHFKVVHQKHGLMQMELYDYQVEAIQKYQKAGRLIMATARQAGKTSIATVILLHAALFNKNKNIVILANRKETAKKILKRIKTAYEHLPNYLKGGVVEWNKESVEFENGSMIFADASEGSSIRGESIFLLYVDEHAFIENYEEFAASVLPTVSSNEDSKIIFTSTPNGLNAFWEYYKNAKEGISEFELVEAPWWRVPGRGEKWKERTLAELNYNQMKFEQEYCVEFMGSSGTLINGSTLKRMQAKTPIQYDEHLKIYKEPETDHQYVCIVDTSRGKGLDYHVAQIIDITTVPYQQVCTYRNNMITVSDYAAIIHRLSNYYNKASVLVELNDLGGQVSDILYMDLEYENMLMTENKGRSGKQISGGFGKKVEVGITTSKTVKSIGCSFAKAIIEGEKLKIIDHETIEEFKTFSKKNNSYEAEAGKHDDCVMPIILFAWLTDQDYFKNLTDTDINKELRETSDDDLEDMLLPFGVINDGRDEFVDELMDSQMSYDEFTRFMLE